MAFKSPRSYRDFEKSVRRNYRFFRTQDDEDFLREVLTTATSRSKNIKQGQRLWRAQIGSEEEEDPGSPNCGGDRPLGRQRMKPRRARATEGRANPRGIPTLYLSTSRETAIAEVRPWGEALVTLALFRTVRSLRVVDLTSTSPLPKGNPYSPWRGKDLPPAVREKLVWSDICRSFAEPTNRSDDVADYASTQIIAELFKKNRFHGIVYKSRLGRGCNVALFDLTAAEPEGAVLYRVDVSPWRGQGVRFSFRQCDNWTQFARNVRSKSN